MLGVDDFIAMHQPLSATMMFIDDELPMDEGGNKEKGDSNGGVDSCLDYESQFDNGDSILPGTSAASADLPMTDHWLGDPNRSRVDDPDATLGLRGVKRRGVKGDHAGTTRKGAKPRRKGLGRVRKNADILAASKRLVEMSWLPRAQVSSPTSTSDIPTTVMGSGKKAGKGSLAVENESTHSIAEEKLFARGRLLKVGDGTDLCTMV